MRGPDAIVTYGPLRESWLFRQLDLVLSPVNAGGHNWSWQDGDGFEWSGGYCPTFSADAEGARQHAIDQLLEQFSRSLKRTRESLLSGDVP